MIDNNFNKFWLKKSNLLKWKKKPNLVLKKKKNFYQEWYPDGTLNVYENCISNNINSGLGSKIAIYTVNSKNEIDKFSYQDLNKFVNNFCRQILIFLKNKNISKKKIMIHSSSSIYSAVSMLACSKLGVHFSVIFEDLENSAINNRIKLFKPDIFISKWNKKKFFKKFFDLKLPKSKIYFFENIKLSAQDHKVDIKTKFFKSNKSLFTLFTSGSTGFPKGIEHSSGGYLVYTKLTCINQFGINSDSTVLTASDAGWINGHTYSLFGPLTLGATTVLVEKPMQLIDINLLKKILNLNVSILYLPVTLIRLLRAINKNMNIKSKSLVTLGSMGEPLAPSIGKWFSKSFNLEKKSIINTYYQTETSGIISSPKFTDKSKLVPHGSVGKVVTNKIIISKLNKIKKNEIQIKSSWPGCMKKVINGKKEWMNYWSEKGHFRMFDLGVIKNSNIYIHGRIDDVMNIRGHRIGSEELESVVLKVADIHECSAVLTKDSLEGSKITLFVVSKKHTNKKIENIIFSNFGSFAIPQKIVYLSELPKTRSGKILRRLLRNLIDNPKSKNLGDTSTMLNPKIINEIKKKLIDNS